MTAVVTELAHRLRAAVDETEKPALIEPNVEPGPKPQLQWIVLAKLTVDRRYQREIGATNVAHSRKIAREFRWSLCTPLVVSKVDGGNYVVIDGQHRLLAAQMHPSIDALPCWVIEAKDLAEQARAFEALNRVRIGVSRLQRFWASLAAGDPMAIRIKALCDRAGVTISRTGGNDLPPRTLSCVHAIEKLTPLGDPAIGGALKLILETQGDIKSIFRSSIISALTNIIAADGKAFDRPAWVRALQRTDLLDIEAAARATRVKQGGSLDAAVEQRLRRAFERASGKVAS